MKRTVICTVCPNGCEITVDYTVAQWTENFIDYLRSSMSYCNFTEILDFVGGPDIMLLSESAKQSINK